MNDREITLNAIINYIGDNLETSDKSWSFKGLELDISATELLKLIYYVNPEVFNGLKAYAESKAKEDEKCNIQ